MFKCKLHINCQFFVLIKLYRFIIKKKKRVSKGLGFYKHSVLASWAAVIPCPQISLYIKRRCTYFPVAGKKPPCIVYCCSVSKSCLTLCDPMDCSIPGFLSFTISRSLLKLMSIELVMSSNRLIFCHPFSPCPQYFPTSGSFPMSWLFVSDGQSIGVSASASVLPVNIQG